MNLSSQSLDEIAELCRDETRNFVADIAHTTYHCFELFRRALQKEIPDAFRYVHVIYQQLVHSWVYRHPNFYSSDEVADYFVNAAFTNFYFAIRGDKFNSFHDVSALLQYLKMCVHSTIAQHLRKHVQQQEISLDDVKHPITNDTADKSIIPRVIWERVEELLSDEVDLKLAHLVFVQHLKPAEISRLYTDWETPRSVSVALQRIRRRLRNDPVLQEFAGIN